MSSSREDEQERMMGLVVGAWMFVRGLILSRGMGRVFKGVPVV